MAYYLNNGNDGFKVYDKPNPIDHKVVKVVKYTDTVKSSSYVLSKEGAEEMKEGDSQSTTMPKEYYFAVDGGYARAKDVYACNINGQAGHDKYGAYFSSDRGNAAVAAYEDETPNTLILLKEITMTCNMNGLFTYTKPDNDSKNKCGYLNSGAKFSILELHYYTSRWMQFVTKTDCTTSNSQGKWYKIYNASGNTGGTVKGKWVNISAIESALVRGEETVIGESSSKDKKDDATAPVNEESTTQSYSTKMTAEDYNKNLAEGLRVEDLRGIFGMPHQFLPLTDPRISASNGKEIVGLGETSELGATYTEKIIVPIPLLLITPGSPEFMSSYNDSQKKTMLGAYIDKAIDSLTLDSLINENTGKFYSLKYNYTEYFYYVNAMCRSAAYFLNIQDHKIDGTALSELNWLYYAGENGGDVFGHKGLSRFLGPYAGALPFYVDSDTSIGDSFSNSTSTPSIADSVNGLSDQARELNFLMGTVSSATGGILDDFVATDGASNNLESVTSAINKMFDKGKGGLLTNLTNHVNTILSGGKMVFPEIWTDSQFSRDYSVKLKFVSPSGDPLSVYLNCLVGVFHCLGLVWPRQSTAQAYYSPFLIRAYYKGLFNIDMGIITGMSLTKGGDGEWTIDGLPTSIEVSFEIKDLYNGIFMSKQTASSDTSILSNITELDYIANMCGININEPDVIRTVEMYLSLGIKSNIKDRIEIGIFGKFGQWANQKMQNIFGKF